MFGGYLSHGAIVSREMYKPSIQNISINDFKKLRSGLNITLDANRSTILINNSTDFDEPPSKVLSLGINSSLFLNGMYRKWFDISYIEFLLLMKVRINTMNYGVIFMISIIIPTYNSAEILEENILRITEFFREKKEFELIIIVDGSSDESIRILHNLTLKISQLRIVSYTPNRGKGYAILKGFQVSRGQNIAIYDIDMSASLNSLFELINIQKNEKYDMVLGSRYLTKKELINQGHDEFSVSHTI